MSGTNPVGNWALPFSTGGGVQDPTTYKGNLDSDMAVAQRVADAFAPRPASPAAMSVVVDSGFIDRVGPAGLQTITEVAAQTVTIATAPSSPNNRIDLIVLDAGTGTASVIAGTPASSPAAPAITAGKRKIAQVAVPNGTTAIGNGAITDLRATWGAFTPGVSWAIAGGSADTITAAYTPVNAALVDGLILGFRASAANATTTPSFNPDALGAKTIVKQGGVALVAGDIPGALAECLLRYNLANTRWELLNAAKPQIVASTNPAYTALLSGSGNYSTPTDAKQLLIRMIGGGGAGGDGGTGGANGGSGGDSSFNSITAKGGGGGAAGSGGSAAGGTSGGIGSGTADLRIQGSAGNTGQNQSSATIGQPGALSALGGAGAANANATTGIAAAANSGSGGSAGGNNGEFGGTGAAGEYIEFHIDSPSGNYAYVVSTGGAASANTFHGGNGGSGGIWVKATF